MRVSARLTIAVGLTLWACGTGEPPLATLVMDSGSPWVPPQEVTTLEEQTSPDVPDIDCATDEDCEPYFCDTTTSACVDGNPSVG